jgi:hypothetical protein
MTLMESIAANIERREALADGLLRMPGIMFESDNHRAWLKHTIAHALFAEYALAHKDLHEDLALAATETEGNA